MKSQKLKGNLLLLLTALIWGTAFVAQSSAMDHIGPFSFMAVRYLLGGLVLLPIIFIFTKEKTKDRKTLLSGGLCCGVFLFVASAFQQVGIQYTTTAKGGFITALYVIFVPLIGLFFKRRPGWLIWLSVALSILGFYLLCMNEKLVLQKGDALMLCSALCFAGHILVIDYFSPKTDGVKMSCLQFFVCSALSAVFMLIFEKPNIYMVAAAGIPILYTGILSSGVGYTLQIVAQKFTDPVVASLLCSLESVFAALAGFVCWKLGLISNGGLSLRELFGCILVFSAVILAQLPLPKRKKA